MDQAEASGKTVEDARNKALAKLGARLDEVEFTVLDEGKRGGLFGRGAQDAVVRVVRLAPQDRESAGGGPPRPGPAAGRSSAASQRHWSSASSWLASLRLPSR